MLDVAIQFPQWLRPEVFPPLGPFQLGDMTIGPFVLRWYALAYIAGLLLGWRYMTLMIREPRLWGGRPAPVNALQLDDFLFWATIGVIVGGRLGYILFYKPDMIWLKPGELIAIWHGGMSFHGGLLGVAAAIWYFARKHKIPLFTLGDLVAAAAPIGLFFGRLANFVNAELYGRATDAPWAMQFPIKIDGQIVSYTEPRHPSQLYEALLEGVVLFAILRVATHRRLSMTRPGLTAGLFLAGYGFVRLLVEFVREPDSHMPDALKGIVTMGMLLCLPMIAIGVWLMRRAPAAKAAPKTA